ncbi:ead/Ea22-like family protein, partial [Klebsiella pneumoniae]|nr:ead/Ea22-like family protein [Klebsiella pneumoniae]
MTDITELAQSLKAAAVRVIKNYDSEWFEAGRQICTVHKSKINLISLANPANVLALVEALESEK